MLFRSPSHKSNLVQAGQAVTLGGEAYSIGPPYGSMIVSAFLVPQPLPGPARKDEVEASAQPYFAWLRDRLKGVAGSGGKADAAFEFVTTLPKP